jgi:tetratricopeptide (TPR) repeat protein
MSSSSYELIRRAAQAKQENRLDDAKQDLLAAITFLRQESPDVDLAHALRSLGEIERKLHNHDAARQHYEEAVAIYRWHRDPLTLAHTIRHLGDVHHEARRLDLAEASYREALLLYRADPQTPSLELANAIRSMAVLLSETGERAQARSLWQEARELYAAVNVMEGVAESSARLAHLSA